MRRRSVRRQRGRCGLQRYVWRWTAGRAELGQFAFDVHVDGAVEVDALAARWRDVSRQIDYLTESFGRRVRLTSSGVPDPLMTCWPTHSSTTGQMAWQLHIFSPVPQVPFCRSWKASENG